ncbi:MAG: hypothetical protein IJK14_01780, partial [Clostridia bacterium]|nr:hypothetical protein [Clostridia bacterium]
MFKLRTYYPPDFSGEQFRNCPDAVLKEAPADGVAPFDYHSMSIFPEYFKHEGSWFLACESRMDCCAVYRDHAVHVVEFRNLKKGDLVFTGRTEDGSEGIYVYPDGFRETRASSDVFAFRGNRTRETAFS